MSSYETTMTRLDTDSTNTPDEDETRAAFYTYFTT